MWLWFFRGSPQPLSRRGVIFLIALSSALALGSGQMAGPKVVPDSPEAQSMFGWSVDVSNNLAVASAWYEDAPAADQGAVRLFNVTQNSVVQVAMFTASDGVASDLFGYSVAIDNEYIVVSAYGAGAAYLFHVDGSGLVVELAILTASDGAGTDDGFGYDVAISGEYIVVTARDEDSLGDRAGAAYLFRAQDGGTNVTQVAKIRASDGGAGDWFGNAVAMDGDLILIGAYRETEIIDPSDIYSGSAYLFQIDADGLGVTQRQKLQVRYNDDPDSFGSDVAIKDGYLVIGAANDPSPGSNIGTAYLFKLVGPATATYITKLDPPDTQFGDRIGSSVAVSGNHILLGSKEHDELGDESGAAFLYEIGAGDSTTFLGKLTASDGASDDLFGQSIALDGDLVLIGAAGEDTNGDLAGAVYFFGLPEMCGDGVENTQFGEECDDGNNIDGDGSCQGNCLLPVCGDGILDVGLGETCDDGNNANGDGCLGNCMPSTCGDGFVDVNEECDDGNTVNQDGCQSDCALPVCGDGILDADEECDDGNDVNEDDCRNDCVFPFCGDGVEDPGEGCDNPDSRLCNDDCTPVLTVEVLFVTGVIVLLVGAGAASLAIVIGTCRCLSQSAPSCLALTFSSSKVQQQPNARDPSSRQRPRRAGNPSPPQSQPQGENQARSQSQPQGGNQARSQVEDIPSEHNIIKSLSSPALGSSSLSEVQYDGDDIQVVEGGVDSTSSPPRNHGDLSSLSHIPSSIQGENHDVYGAQTPHSPPPDYDAAVQIGAKLPRASYTAQNHGHENNPSPRSPSSLVEPGEALSPSPEQSNGPVSGPGETHVDAKAPASLNQAIGN